MHSNSYSATGYYHVFQDDDIGSHLSEMVVSYELPKDALIKVGNGPPTEIKTHRRTPPKKTDNSRNCCSQNFRLWHRRHEVRHVLVEPARIKPSACEISAPNESESGHCRTRSTRKSPLVNVSYYVALGTDADHHAHVEQQKRLPNTRSKNSHEQ